MKIREMTVRQIRIPNGEGYITINVKKVYLASKQTW